MKRGISIHEKQSVVMIPATYLPDRVLLARYGQATLTAVLPPHADCHTAPDVDRGAAPGKLPEVRLGVVSIFSVFLVMYFRL